MSAVRVPKHLVLILLAVLLAACAGTPQREEGVIRGPPPFSACGVLVSTHDRTVDQRHRARRPGRQGFEHSNPHAGPGPAVEAIVDGRMGPVALEQVPPRRAGPQHVEDPIQHRRSSTRATPRGLFGSSGLISRHSSSLRSNRAIFTSCSRK